MSSDYIRTHYFLVVLSIELRLVCVWLPELLKQLRGHWPCKPQIDISSESRTDVHTQIPSRFSSLPRRHSSFAFRGLGDVEMSFDSDPETGIHMHHMYAWGGSHSTT